MPDAPPSRAALGAATIERGLKDLRWSTICRMASALGVPVLELVAIAERIELD